VRRVNPAGVISTVTTFPPSQFNYTAAAVQGLTRDMQGNIYASTSTSYVYKVSGYNSPVTISNIGGAVSASDSPYKMDVTFNLSGVVCPAKARVTIDTVTQYQQLCNAGDSAPTTGTVKFSVLGLNPKHGVHRKGLRG